MSNGTAIIDAISGVSEDLASDSKRSLILAGERLFASRGVEGASLREIATAAGHGNNNAVRYHFGSKEGLIQAIFRYRVAQLEPLRRRLMAVIDEKGLTGDARSLLEVIALPHLTLRNEEGKFPYAAFLLQYLLHYRPRGMIHAADELGAISASLNRAMSLLRARLFYLSNDTVDRRIMAMTALFLSVLINTENQVPTPSPEVFKDLIDDTLCQMVASVITPISRLPHFLDESFFPLLAQD